MTMYRMGLYDCGAFEHSAPSLGILFTKLTLRCRLLGQACRMANVAIVATVSTVPNDYAMPDGVLEVDTVQPVHSDAGCGDHYDV